MGRGASSLRNRAITELTDNDKAFIRSCLIYEDEAILAFNKPSGLPVQTRQIEDRTLDHLLWAFARSNGKRPRLVHRLDAETSGVILAARTQPAAAHLSQSFEHRLIQKTYLAICHGVPRLAEGVITKPIRSERQSDGRTLSVVATRKEQGKPSETRWKWVASSYAGTHSLIECQPLTGRMHQIRVHLAGFGLPIVGDPTYGASTKNEEGRLMLHAAGLSGPHPNGMDVNLHAPLPKDMQDTLGRLEVDWTPA